MPLTTGDIVILSQLETSRLNAQTGVEPVIRIAYMLRKFGPFVLDFPKEGFRGKEAVTAIRADAEHRLEVIEAFNA